MHIKFLLKDNSIYNLFLSGTICKFGKILFMYNKIDSQEVLKTIGENIHTVRNAKKETLDCAAKAIGMTHPTLSKIENGRYPGLTMELIITICNHFKVTLQQIIGLEMLQIFNLNQTAENGSSGTTLKQVVNDIADGYLKALEQANSEIAFLRSQIAAPPIKTPPKSK